MKNLKNYLRLIEKNLSKDGSGMTAAIDRLEKQVNKEEVEKVNEISVDSASNYIRKRTFGYVKTMKGQVQPSDVYNKMSDKHKAGISRAMDRVVKPVKEEVKLNHKHLLKDTSGKVRTFMLRRSAAKEAHINGGVVHKMGKGYVIKIKENEDAKSTKWRKKQSRRLQHGQNHPQSNPLQERKSKRIN